MKLMPILLLAGTLLAASPMATSGQTRDFRTTNRMVLGTPTDLTASIVFADVDGDGDQDALLANGRHWAQANEVYLNNGRGRFTMGYPLGPEKATTYGVPVGDLDGDGDPDAVVANDMAESWVYLNDGQGGFQKAWPVSPEIEPTRSAQLHDLDGDGALDLLVTNRGSPNGYFLNDGQGTSGPNDLSETRRARRLPWPSAISTPMETKTWFSPTGTDKPTRLS
jgi:hypothetical protein